MTPPTGSPTRVDKSLGIKEETGFFGAGTQMMYECRHLPLGDVQGGVVICPSIHAEVLSNYRPEVELARALAARGLAVQRFHYRGTGNSDGEPSAMTIESMQADALGAVDHFKEMTGIGKLGFMGARVGALVALAAAESHGAAPVSMWEPVLDFKRYFREIVRFQRIREMKTAEPQPAAEDPVAVLEEKGSYDILGYSLDRSLYESALRRSLEDVLGTPPRPLQLIQLSTRDELRAPYKKLVEALRERSWLVEAHAFPEEPVWWLLRAPIKGLDKLIDLTVSWLAANIQRGEAS